MSVQFDIPFCKEDLYNPASTSGYHINEIYSNDEMIDNLKNFQFSLQEQGPDCIYTYFNIFFSVIKEPSLVDKDLKLFALENLIKIFKENETSLIMAIESEENVINIPKIYVINFKMLIYLMCLFITELDLDSNSTQLIFTKGVGQKGKKDLQTPGYRKKGNDISPYHNSIDPEKWEKKRNICLSLVYDTLKNVSIHMLWNPPLMDAKVTEMICNTCYKLMECIATAKNKETQGFIMLIIGICITKYHLNLNGFSIKILNLLQNFEHSATIIPRFIHDLIINYNIGHALGIIMKDLETISSQHENVGTYGSVIKDASSPLRSLSIFLVELSNLEYKHFLPYMGLLIRYLDGQSYSLRNAVLHIIGQIILKGLTNQDATSEPSNNDKTEYLTRDKYFTYLKTHLYDVNALVRSRVFQILYNVQVAGAVPNSWVMPFAQAAADRLYDKSSNVRKNAAQFLAITLQNFNNIKGGNEPYHFLSSTLKSLESRYKKEKGILEEIIKARAHGTSATAVKSRASDNVDAGHMMAAAVYSWCNDEISCNNVANQDRLLGILEKLEVMKGHVFEDNLVAHIDKDVGGEGGCENGDREETVGTSSTVLVELIQAINELIVMKDNRVKVIVDFERLPVGSPVCTKNMDVTDRKILLGIFYLINNRKYYLAVQIFDCFYTLYPTHPIFCLQSESKMVETPNDIKTTVDQDKRAVLLLESIKSFYLAMRHLQNNSNLAAHKTALIENIVFEGRALNGHYGPSKDNVIQNWDALEQQVLVVDYFKYHLEYYTLMVESVFPTMLNLLFSSTQTDCIEAMSFFTLCLCIDPGNLLGRRGINASLIHVCSKDANIRDKMVKNMATLFFLPRNTKLTQAPNAIDNEDDNAGTTSGPLVSGFFKKSVNGRMVSSLQALDNLLTFVAQLNGSEMTSFEELIKDFYKYNLLPHDFGDLLMLRFKRTIADIINLSKKQKRSYHPMVNDVMAILHLIRMLDGATANLINSISYIHLNTLIQKGFNPNLPNALVIGHLVCQALHKLSRETEIYEGRVVSIPFRLNSTHMLFSRLLNLIITKFDFSSSSMLFNLDSTIKKMNGIMTKSPTVNEVKNLTLGDQNEDDTMMWPSFCQSVIQLIYKLCNNPEFMCQRLLNGLRSTAFPDYKCEDLALREVISTRLAGIIFVVGDVALQHFTYVYESFLPHLKARTINEQPFQPGSSDIMGRANEKGSSNDISYTREQSARTEDEELRLIATETDDKELDFVKAICDKDLFSGEDSLLSPYLSLILDVVKDIGIPSLSPDVIHLRNVAILSLLKFMIINAPLCERHLPLIFTILSSSTDVDQKIAIITGLSDLTVKFPTICEMWVPYLYERLNDESLAIRLITLKVLSHLICHDMIIIKEQISEIAKRLVDPEESISHTAQIFFEDLSSKSNAIYNTFPDILGKLSQADTFLEMGPFTYIMNFLCPFIQKERQVEGIIEKIFQRIHICSDAKQSLYLIKCVVFLSHTDRSIKKIIDALPLYQDKLGDTSFAIVVKDIFETFKPEKPEFKDTIAEYIKRLEQVIKHALDMEDLSCKAKKLLSLRKKKSNQQCKMGQQTERNLIAIKSPLAHLFNSELKNQEVQIVTTPLRLSKYSSKSLKGYDIGNNKHNIINGYTTPLCNSCHVYESLVKKKSLNNPRKRIDSKRTPHIVPCIRVMHDDELSGDHNEDERINGKDGIFADAEQLSFSKNMGEPSDESKKSVSIFIKKKVSKSSSKIYSSTATKVMNTAAKREYWNKSASLNITNNKDVKNDSVGALVRPSSLISPSPTHNNDTLSLRSFDQVVKNGCRANNINKDYNSKSRNFLHDLGHANRLKLSSRSHQFKPRIILNCKDIENNITSETSACKNSRPRKELKRPPMFLRQTTKFCTTRNNDIEQKVKRSKKVLLIESDED